MSNQQNSLKSYLIGYDLHEGEDYEELINAIKEFGTWWHHLDSTWIVKSTLSQVEIRDLLKPHIKDDDKLLVALLEGGAAWVGFSEKGSTWLQENL